MNSRALPSLLASGALAVMFAIAVTDLPRDLVHHDPFAATPEQRSQDAKYPYVLLTAGAENAGKFIRGQRESARHGAL